MAINRQTSQRITVFSPHLDLDLGYLIYQAIRSVCTSSTAVIPAYLTMGTSASRTIGNLYLSQATT
jgi:hypothetical protein